MRRLASRWPLNREGPEGGRRAEGGPVQGGRPGLRGGHLQGRRRPPSPHGGSRRGEQHGRLVRARVDGDGEVGDGGDGGDARDADGNGGGDDTNVDGDVTSVEYWRSVATNLLEKVQLLQESSRGTFQQFQREIDDFREQQQSRAAPTGDATAGIEGSDDEVAFTGTGRAPPDEHMVGAIPSAPQELSAADKFDIREWRNLSGAHRRIWLIMAGRPASASMSAQEMTVCLRHVGAVSKDVTEMMNTLSGFDIRAFVGIGDAPGAKLGVVEHLEVLISAVGTFLRQQACGSVARDRVARLEGAFEVGLGALRSHVSRFRSKLKNPANKDLLTEKVNQSINEWSAKLMEEAGQFGQRHRSGPPPADAYPDVFGPDYRDLLAWFQASGLGVLPDLPQCQQAPVSSAGTTEAASRSGAKSGYCFRFQEGACPRSARQCRYIHEADPSWPKASTSDGGGSNGGGGAAMAAPASVNRDVGSTV